MSSPLYRFAHSRNSLEPFVEHYDYGWFDGGCFIFARALQLWLGGRLAVIVRQELLYEQTFDHVVLSLPDVPGFCEPLYVDADGIASADELLKRWRTREHLHCPTLDDPAECARFVGHLNQEFVSCWLAQELEIRFGQPEGNDLLRALGGTPRRRIA